MIQVDFFKQFSFFNKFSDAQLAKLAGISDLKTYRRRDTVYKAGDPNSHLHMVASGLVSMSGFGPTHRMGIVYAHRRPGDIFGCGCFMDSGEHTLTAICEEDCEVLEIRAEELLRMCESDPDLGFKFVKNIAQVFYERYKYAKRRLQEMIKVPDFITYD